MKMAFSKGSRNDSGDGEDDMELASCQAWGFQSFPFSSEEEEPEAKTQAF